MDPETRVLRADDGEDLVILACTVFDWSTRMTGGWTDRQNGRIVMAKMRYRPAVVHNKIFYVTKHT